MAKAGSLAELEALHSLVTQSYTLRIKTDLDEGFATDAATLSSAAKFLKDNAITADPADKEDLKGLQAQLKKAAEERQLRAQAGRKIVELVQDDMVVNE